MDALYLIPMLLSIFLRVGKAQLTVNVVAPPWILAGEEATWLCNFQFDNVDDVDAVYWTVGDQGSDDQYAATPLISYLYPGTIDGPAKDRVEMNPTTFALTIPVVEYSLDQKRYWCSATTQQGSDNDSKNSSVSVRPTGITLLMDESEVKNDTEYTIEDKSVKHNFACRVTKARPAASITWIFGEDNQNGNQVDSTNENDPQFTDSVNELLDITIEKSVTLQLKVAVEADNVGTLFQIHLKVPVPSTSEPQPTTTLESTTDEDSTSAPEITTQTFFNSTAGSDTSELVSAEMIVTTSVCSCDDDSKLCVDRTCSCDQGYVCLHGACTEIKTKSVKWTADGDYLPINAHKEALRQCNAMDSATKEIEDYRGCCVIKLKPGSIKSTFQIYIDVDSNLNNAQIEESIIAVINRGEVVGVNVDTTSLSVGELDECKENLHDCVDPESCKNTDNGYCCESDDCNENNAWQPGSICPCVKASGNGLIIGLSVTFVVLGIVVIVVIIIAVMRYRSKNKVAAETPSQSEEDRKVKKDNKKEDEKTNNDKNDDDET